MRISKTIKGLLFEAYRRNCSPLNYDIKDQPLRQRWLGLGTEAAYRSVINAGLMVFFDGKVPPRCCMGWLVLTPEGITLFNELSEEFEKEMQKLRADPEYRRSYWANYTLAGGLARR